MIFFIDYGACSIKFLGNLGTHLGTQEIPSVLNAM